MRSEQDILDSIAELQQELAKVRNSDSGKVVAFVRSFENGLSNGKDTIRALKAWLSDNGFEQTSYGSFLGLFNKSYVCFDDRLIFVRADGQLLVFYKEHNSSPKVQIFDYKL